MYAKHVDSSGWARPPRSLSPTASDADHAPHATVASKLLGTLVELIASLLGGRRRWRRWCVDLRQQAVSGSPSPRPSRVYQGPQPRASGPSAAPPTLLNSTQHVNPPVFATGDTSTVVSPHVEVNHCYAFTLRRLASTTAGGWAEATFMRY
ncbi:hypothetical protein HK405_001383, partial [Cladochytrium tenue]